MILVLTTAACLALATVMHEPSPVELAGVDLTFSPQADDNFPQVYALQQAKSDDAVEGAGFLLVAPHVGAHAVTQLNRANCCKRSCCAWFECGCGEEQDATSWLLSHL